MLLLKTCNQNKNPKKPKTKKIQQNKIKQNIKKEIV